MRNRKAWIALLSTMALLPIGCTANPTETVDVPDQATETSTSPQSQQIIKITGAGTPYPAMELLATAYTSQTNDTTITFLESSQTGGGIAGVKEGLVEIGTATRAPKAEEAADDLVHREFAKDALLVATHPSIEGVTNLTTEELQAIYSGQATNWQDFGGPDATIVVLDRAEDESAKRLLREYYLGADLENAPDAVVLRNESDLIEAIQTTPYSIGAFSLAQSIAKDLPVNPISLNGVAPTTETLASGDYAMARTLGIVWYGTPSETTQAFIDFIFSEAGANVLTQAGFSPSK
ncbi:MAG: substrate-binding domain-containing protein [Cyanobacteria bacterium J06635_15]